MTKGVVEQVADRQCKVRPTPHYRNAIAFNTQVNLDAGRDSSRSGNLYFDHLSHVDRLCFHRR